ncbi:ATP-binding protein [Paenibacillus sp. sgz5001063]|uniref:ATP-binding protein n=1 Tax=Paenibacillus sp. sgz5001063 TaxID=3242474 RepID=UPI0036D38F1F
MRTTHPSNVSMKTKYFRIITLLFTFLVLSISVLFFYINSQQSRLKSERELLQNKAHTIDQLAGMLNEVFFRARGYVALKSTSELGMLNTALENLDDILKQYSGLDLSPEEAEYRDALSAYYTNYKNQTLPKVIRMIEKDDYEGIRNLSQSGSTQALNDFLAYTKTFKTRSDEKLSELADRSIRKADSYTVAAFGISAFLLLFFTLMIWRMLKVLIDPIVRLEEAAHSLAAGEAVLLGSLNKRDEMGRLYEAFLNMARSIQDKEEELTMQNEELHAQQDELQDQQFKLERSLSEINSMMKALDQTSAVGILSAKGLFTYANDNLSSYTGYRNSEIIGHPFRLFKLLNIDAAQVEQIISKLSTGGDWSGETEVLAKEDQGSVWLHMMVMPYLNDEGKVYQYILIANNITSLKNVQQQLAVTLQNTEQTTFMLERYNQLNHDLTYTLDKQEFAEKFSGFMNRIYGFDSSLFLLVKDKIAVVKGVPKANVERYLDHNHSDILHRLGEEKSYIVKRTGSPREQGISPDEVYCYDYYTSVVGSSNEILAVFCGSRIGRTFTEEELSEIQGLMSRVALAIERLMMYEEIEHGRKLNRDILNNVNEGIQFVNTAGVIQHINKALNQLFRYSDRTGDSLVSAEDWLDAFTGKSNESTELRQFYEHAMSEAAVDSSTMKYSLGSEEIKHVDVYAIPVLRRKERIGTLFVHRDITREYELDLMKSELVSTVSHELRTPLSSVLGFTELLLSKTMKPEKQLKYLETIHKEAKRLTELINDFLDLQRMESGTQQYHVETAHLSEIVLGVIDQYKLSSTHHILLEDGAVHDEVAVDRDKIIQVLTNLLSNAIKFSPESHEVKVLLRNEPNQIIVRIQDYGLGIPKNQISQLFQKFRRVDNSASKRIGGTGLGLAICKEIIEKHQGAIGIESVEGEGTTVWFSLPVEIAEDSRPVEESAKWGMDKEEKPNVMIVEDDYSLSLLLSEELKGKGFQVTHHYHPQKAFDQAINSSFVAIVVDLMLGVELDGWDLIRMLKNDPRTEQVPIVISSALDKTDKSMLENVKTYLTKPYPPGELSSTLQAIVDIRLKSGEVLFPDNTL